MKIPIVSMIDIIAMRFVTTKVSLNFSQLPKTIVDSNMQAIQRGNGAK